MENEHHVEINLHNLRLGIKGRLTRVMHILIYIVWIVLVVGNISNILILCNTKKTAKVCSNDVVNFMNKVSFYEYQWNHVHMFLTFFVFPSGY